jgi:hypothetical protein
LGVHAGYKDIMLGHIGCELQVYVGDGTSGVVVGHDAVLHFGWKGGAPEHG